uniref:Uncharacterized protein n=1 Tax=Kalanchoe fedtschenkoi TaxID=63787 RepID=A0A7N1A1G2_KALFE
MKKASAVASELWALEICPKPSFPPRKSPPPPTTTSRSLFHSSNLSCFLCSGSLPTSPSCHSAPISALVLRPQTPLYHLISALDLTLLLRNVELQNGNQRGVLPHQCCDIFAVHRSESVVIFSLNWRTKIDLRSSE